MCIFFQTLYWTTWSLCWISHLVPFVLSELESFPYSSCLSSIRWMYFATLWVCAWCDKLMIHFDRGREFNWNKTFATFWFLGCVYMMWQHDDTNWHRPPNWWGKDTWTRKIMCGRYYLIREKKDQISNSGNKDICEQVKSYVVFTIL